MKPITEKIAKTRTDGTKYGVVLSLTGFTEAHNFFHITKDGDGNIILKPIYQRTYPCPECGKMMTGFSSDEMCHVCCQRLAPPR